MGRSETEAERAAALKNAELTAGEVSISQQPALALPFAIHFTLAKTGLRPGELTHTLIEDLDLDVGWLRARGKPELGWNVKTGTDRDIPLAPEVIHVLRQLIGDRSVRPVFRRVKITLDNPPKLVECLAPPPAGRRGLVFF